MRTNRWNVFGSTLLAGLLTLSGCGEPAGLVTVPVTGKLTFVRGGPAKVLADRQGIIEFESVEQPGVFAYGEIQPDGSFELASVKGDIGQPGAVKGEHRVRLRLDETARQFVAPQFLRLESSRINVTTPDEIVEVKVWR